ncbi:MAG: sigma-70 family RNA polymerase sigma factor [Polyangiaceae bacterium]
MSERNLSEPFEQNRAHLRAVAYRMLGNQSEADDAVQEAWLRLNRAGSAGVDNLGGWLTTVVARVCLDMLRARKSRREEALDLETRELAASSEGGAQPERERLLADSVGLALLVVLETLAPAERVAFVLHDLFDLPFDQIAPILGRSAIATRQLASRARRHVQGVGPDPDADISRQRVVVDAFLAASRGGDLSALLAVLDPDVVLRPDRYSLEASAARRAQGAPELAPEMRGADAVAQAFFGRAKAARPALIDGAVGAVWAPGGQVRAVFAMTIIAGKVTEMELLYDPEQIPLMDIQLL